MPRARRFAGHGENATVALPFFACWRAAGWCWLIDLTNLLVNYFHAGVVRKKATPRLCLAPKPSPSGQARASTRQAGRRAGKQHIREKTPPF